MRRRHLRRFISFVCVPFLAACSSGAPSAPTELQIRPVLGETTGTTETCPRPVQVSPTASNVKACSADGTTLYTLGPAAVTGDEVSDTQVQSDASNGYAVVVRFSDSGASAFQALTRQLASQDAPNNQFAFYVRGVVQSSPYVSEEINSGTTEITGFPSESQASQFLIDASNMTP